MNRHRRRAGALITVAGLVLAAMGLVAPAATAQPSNANLNHPSYYEGLGYGTCIKTEDPGDPYVLPPPPAGTYWTLLVLKAGSAASNDDWNTLVENPTPGPYVHPSGKDLSHIIRCYKPGSPPSSTTTTTTSTSIPGPGCDDYTPTMLAVAPPTASPGDQVTVTGQAQPGDTVTFTLSGNSITPVNLGSTVVGPTGSFSFQFVVPNVGAGTYTITASSTQCPSSATVSIVVVPLTFSGCGENNAGRTFKQGQNVIWELHEQSFDTTKPVSLRLYKTGYSQVLYNGPWPASNEAPITIPATAPTGKYTMEQKGTKVNGKIQTKTCPVWVELAAQPIAAGSGSGDTASPDVMRLSVTVLALAAGSYALVRLRMGRRRSRRTA